MRSEMAQPNRITSRQNPLLVRLRKLASDPLAYRKQGQLWLEGEHLCEAYAGRGAGVAQAVITEAAWEQQAMRELASRADAVCIVSPVLMASLSTMDSCPPLAFAVPWSGQGVAAARWPSIVLDRVQDAGNVGSMLRSAAAFGFRQVLALKGTAGLWTPKVLRAAMGAHFGLRLVEAMEPAALARLQLPLLAASSHAALAIDQASLPWPCAWVFGHEGQGVAPALMAQCAQTLRIPQPGGEESLNVGAAAAVCLYESMRQRAAQAAAPT